MPPTKDQKTFSTAGSLGVRTVLWRQKPVSSLPKSWAITKPSPEAEKQQLFRMQPEVSSSKFTTAAPTEDRFKGCTGLEEQM